MHLENIDIQDNLTELRLESFRIMLLLTMIVGWIWFSWSLWPQDSHSLFYSDTWQVSGLLIVVVLLCFAVMQWHVYAAIHLFIGGLIVAITGAILVLGTITISYLYIIPIIFSSLLFSQPGLITTAIITGIAALTTHALDLDLQASDIFTPLTTLTLTTIAIFISTKNLRTTLAWTINGYEEAHKNELIARENKARLEQVLKQLDSTLAKLQRSNAMLIQTRDQADEARRIKQQFAQTISHELRTPLNLIAGFTETMIKSPEYYGGSLPPAYLRDLSVVYRNAAHLQDLVNDVLDLARLESAYMSLESEKLDLVAVIDDAISTARQLVEGRGLALCTELPDHLPPIWGDAVRLKQVVLNLLNNAARFTESGGITVCATTQDSDVIVSVSDTGIGIPAEHIADIFESFRQLENPMQRRNEGAGLGLAISKQLINLHGGRIWAESEVSIGSTFFFSLPVSQVETLTHDTLNNTALGTAKRGQQQVALLVTRSPSAAALVSRSLANFRILVVPELAQVQQAAQQIIPQAIIIDTGTETVQEDDLRVVMQNVNAAHAVIVTCPLPGEEPLRQRFAVDGYLIKPVTHENLWDVLRQFSDALNTVLVVDNDPGFVRLIERMLSNPMRQYQVTYAYTGHEALEMLRRNRPEIILLDINLPDMSGFQIIQHIQADDTLRDMRIVIITAYEEIDHANLLKAPMSISKPSGLKPNEIMSWLRMTLSDNLFSDSYVSSGFFLK